MPRDKTITILCYFLVIRLHVFGRKITKVCCVLFIVYQMVTILVCPITSDVHYDHVVTVGSAEVSPP